MRVSLKAILCESYQNMGGERAYQYSAKKSETSTMIQADVYILDGNIAGITLNPRVERIDMVKAGACDRRNVQIIIDLIKLCPP